MTERWCLYECILVTALLQSIYWNIFHKKNNKIIKCHNDIVIMQENFSSIGMSQNTSMWATTENKAILQGLKQKWLGGSLVMTCV